MRTDGQDARVLADPVDAIIYRLSHDLRASSRAIAEVPDWIAEDLEEAGISLPSKTAESLSLLQKNARRLDSMISGLLIHSRVARQEARLLDASQCVAKTLSAYSSRESARFRWRCEAGLVRMAKNDLDLAIRILVSNAVTHNPGTAKIAVITRALSPWWEFVIRDDGYGIPEKDRARAMEPLTRLRACDDTPTAGMGLAILEKIVRAYDGELDIEGRRIGSGTTVRLRLPLAA